MITQEFFGTVNGETAYKIILENKKGTKIGVSNFGALILSIIIKGKDGIERDIVLGFDNPEGYLERITDIGAYVGRNANRIKGASVCIEGTTYKLDANDGKNNLHSGFTRSHRVFYDFKTGESENGQFIELYRVGLHLEQGFPGNLEQRIRYTLTDEDGLIIDYEMVSDKTTVVNPTNHSYFNLNGHDNGTTLEHELEIYSEGFLSTNQELIPTGDIVDVTDTPMDFREKKMIGRDIQCDFTALKYAGGYDVCYVFENDRKLKKMAKLYSPKSGITMIVWSDLCGLQLYSGNFLNGEVGKNGAIYEKNSAVCLESQFYPNACNEKKFPSSILEAGKKFISRTVYQFEV